MTSRCCSTYARCCHRAITLRNLGGLVIRNKKQALGWRRETCSNRSHRDHPNRFREAHWRFSALTRVVGARITARVRALHMDGEKFLERLFWPLQRAID